MVPDSVVSLCCWSFYLLSAFLLIVGLVRVVLWIDKTMSENSKRLVREEELRRLAKLAQDEAGVKMLAHMKKPCDCACTMCRNRAEDSLFDDPHCHINANGCKNGCRCDCSACFVAGNDPADHCRSSFKDCFWSSKHWYDCVCDCLECNQEEEEEDLWWLSGSLWPDEEYERRGGIKHCRDRKKGCKVGIPFKQQYGQRSGNSADY